MLHHRGRLDGSTYEQWVAGQDVETGDPKGRLRTDAQGVRFVEVIVNGPKTWSLAAAQHPELGEAYDAAQQRAAEEIIGWVAEHATSRVGSRGCQVQVPVTEIEAAVVRHYTSRAGDPHRHLHLQINARVLVGDQLARHPHRRVRDSLDAINGIGHAAVMCDPEFRRVLAAHGYTLDPQSGEVEQLAPYAGAFSARDRADQSQRRPLRGRVARRAPAAKNPVPACGGPGTAARGPTPDPTRWSRATAPTSA